jgi:hypothetical protein
MSTMQPLSGTARMAWPVLLSLGAFLGSWATACVFPFAGFAAVAALTTDLRRGAVALFGVWMLNQAIGYSLLDYPSDATTMAWGVAIGLGAFAAFAAARMVSRFSGALLTAPIAAIAAYELLLYAIAHGLGGLETFSAEIVTLVVRNDAMWFAGLMAARSLLTRTLPSLFGTEPALRTA